MKLLRELSNAEKKESINEMSPPTERALQHGFGLICQTEDGDCDYDAFESTLVFTNKKAFENAIKELFGRFQSNIDFEDVDIEEIYDHEDYEDFCEMFWIVDRF